MLQLAQTARRASTEKDRLRPHWLIRCFSGAVLIGVLAACAAPPTDDVELSAFVEGELIRGRVVQNVTACEVDAVCYLEMEFNDAGVRAIYGTGERPAPPCPISKEVSDAAFPVEDGAIVQVVIRECPGEGFFLELVVAEAG